MPEVLAEFAELVLSNDRRVYRARACGAPMTAGLWEGWIEFIPIAADEAPLRSPRETTQPNRVDAVYWASGLTPTYLEGALDRARRGPIAKTKRRSRRHRPSMASGGMHRPLDGT
jgi:hypothetical protein